MFIKAYLLAFAASVASAHCGLHFLTSLVLWLMLPQTVGRLLITRQHGTWFAKPTITKRDFPLVVARLSHHTK